MSAGAPGQFQKQKDRPPGKIRIAQQACSTGPETSSVSAELSTNKVISPRSSVSSILAKIF